MALQQSDQAHIEAVAGDTLEKLSSISEAARKGLSESGGLGAGSLASVNTMTDSRALKTLDIIGKENREGYRILTDEPAIARVVVKNDNGGVQTYYICRGSTVRGITGLASYRSAVGRLASLDIGSDFTLPNGTSVVLSERAQLRPTHSSDGWDSLDTVLEGDEVGPITIESLRAIFRQDATDDHTEDLLNDLLNEETLRSNIFDGLRRRVITRMALRDQPVLDQYQDEIFRLPLDKRLLILGPPGTGKTTTLIRRLGQKLDQEFLQEEEVRLVEQATSADSLPHSKSWLMFTPTDLLKQYLKEAFAREGVPASDLHIRTWTEFRRELARNTFGILRTAAGGGVYVLKETLQNQAAATIGRSTDWFVDFDIWQRESFLEQLRASANRLFDSSTSEIREVGARLVRALQGGQKVSIAATFEALSSLSPSVQSIVEELKISTDAKIKSACNRELRQNAAFLSELAQFLDELQQPQGADLDDADEAEADDDDDSPPSKTAIAVAFAAYMRAMRAHARATAAKRSLNKTSRNGRVISWLGERTLAQADLAALGAQLIMLTDARRFANPLKRFLDGVSARYRAFRKAREQEGLWYIKDSFEPRDIHPLEVDLILLTILRSSRELLSKTSVLRSLDEPYWSALKPTLQLFRNQILVDEASDFSPLQLACMASLGHPRIGSFFACGDFNQRLTTWGARTIDDMRFVASDMDVRHIMVSYRQSKQLNDFARELMQITGGNDEAATLPLHVDNEGVRPTLLEDAKDEQSVVDWLAERIREIEVSVGKLPSTAIFVNSEDKVAALAAAANTALTEHNIQVVACPQGQVMGQDNDVRVFDVQHIKGLEFEAVFFVGVDRLASLHADLFDKFIYVGATRAAMYLGLTCEGALPKQLGSLKTSFAANWSSSVA